MSPEPELSIQDGELVVPGRVTFVVRPLSGPGTKGPSEVSPESVPALTHVKAYLDRHPELVLRIECTSDLMRAAVPEASVPAHLANLVARWLVERGIDCRRLEPVGVMERQPRVEHQSVRFMLGAGERRLPGEVRADPCAP